MRSTIGSSHPIRHFLSTLLIAVVAASIVTTFSTSALSQTEGDLLSYSELMRLPHEKRVAYIEGVRKIFVELSKDPEARFSDSDPRARSKLKVWLELLDQNFTSEALAASSEPGVGPASASGQLCLTSKFCESALRSCFDQGQGIIWQENFGTYKCNPAVKVGAKTQGARSSVFARVDERAFLQYAENVADPRGKSSVDVPINSNGAPGASGSTVASNVAIEIVPPQQVRQINRPVATESFSPASTSRTLGIPMVAKRPGSQAKTIQEYVELLAQGKIKGKRYSCRSKHQNRTFTNDNGEAIDHSALKECTKEDEDRIQALYDRVAAGNLSLLVSAETAPAANAAANLDDAPSPAADPLAPSQQPAEVVESAIAAPGALESASGAITFPIVRSDTPTSTFGRRITRQEIQPYLDELKNPDLICEEERNILGYGKLIFIPMDDAGSFGRCMSEANARLFQAGGIERHPSDVAQASRPTPKPTGTQAPVMSAAASKFTSCAPQPESCGDRDAVRKAYYQGKLPCVFAGMISNLDGQNRRCKPVMEYNVGEEKLKCDAGQAMCNPLLFGTVLGSSPTKAICVGRGQDVTNQCGKLSTARDAELFINRNAMGLQEKWDEFKTSLDSVCKSQTVSAKFHCQECNTMKLRLFELHARIVGNPCETTLDQGIKTRIQNRSRATKK